MLCRPQVSVVLPVYNGAAFLAESVGSVLTQTLDDFELLIVDDGSTDGSRAIALALADRDSRVRVLVGGGRRGLVEALNAGLLEAKAPFVARMDADDVALPQRLALQVEALRSADELVVVGCRVAYRVEGGCRGDFSRYVDWQNSLLSPEEIERDLFVESPLVHPSVVMRRDRVLEVGGYRDRGWPEDYDLWMRLLHRSWRARKVADVLLVWRDHPQRLSRSARPYRLERFRRLKSHYLERFWLRPRERLIVCGGGPSGRWWVRALRRAGYGISAIVDVDPRRIGSAYHDIPIVGHEDWIHGDRGGDRVLAAVGASRPRREVRRLLEGVGLEERRDFVTVA